MVVATIRNRAAPGRGCGFGVVDHEGSSVVFVSVFDVLSGDYVVALYFHSRLEKLSSFCVFQPASLEGDESGGIHATEIVWVFGVAAS